MALLLGLLSMGFRPAGLWTWTLFRPSWTVADRVKARLPQPETKRTVFSAGPAAWMASVRARP